MEQMLSFGEAVRLGEKIREAALSYRDDPRFRQLVDFAVAESRRETGPFDEERPERYAHELATLAVCIALSRTYTEDLEIRTLRWERDRYKKLAEDSLMIRSPQHFIADAPATMTGKQ